MKRIYASVSLTHVNTEEDKNMIRALIKWLGSAFDAEVMPWAFDLEKWQALPCANITEHDNKMMDASDLMVAFYFTNDGSDGRGAEVHRRMNRYEPLLVFKKRGLRISRYITDDFPEKGVEIAEFDEFTDVAPAIHQAFAELSESLPAGSKGPPIFGDPSQ